MIFVANKKTNEKAVYVSKTVTKTRDILLKAEELDSRVFQMQSGVIGFLLTGKENYLPLFKNASDTVHKILRSLEILTYGSPDEKLLIDTLHQLVTRYILFGDKMINFRKTNSYEVSQNIFLDSLKEHLIDKISFFQKAKEKEQEQKLILINSENASNIKNSFRIITVLQIFVVLVLLLGLITILKNNQKRNQLEFALEKSLKENPDYKYALDQSSILTMTDQAGTLTFVNDNFCKISKYTKEELIGQNHRIVNSGFHTKEFFQDLWTTINAGNIWRGEIKNKDKEGSMHWFDTTIVPFLNEQGISCQYLAIRNNITDKKTAEEKINREKEFADKIINSLPGLFYMSDPTPKLLRWNKEFEEVSGYTAEELENIIPINLFEPEDRVIVKQSLEKTYKEGSADVEARLLTKSGREIPYYFTGVRIMYEGKPAILGSGIDISERKKAERSLSEINQRYKNLIDNMNDGLIVDDISGKVTFANQNFLDMFGITEDELSNFFLEDYVAPEYYEILRGRHDNRIAGEEESETFEFEGMRKDGKRIWIETHVSRIAENGIFTGTQSILRDISGRKKSEEEKERLLNILQKSLNEIYMFSPETLKFEYVNTGAQKNLGYSLEEMLEMTPLDIKPEYTPDKFRKLLAQVIHSEQEKIIFETVHKRKDESLYPVEAHLQMITYNGQSVFLALILDITERKNAEKEIKRSNERFELIARATNDALWDWNLKTNKGWGNEIHQQLYGLTMNDPVPDNEEWKNRIHPDDRKRVVEMLKNTLASEQIVFIEEYRFYAENKGWLNVYGRTLIERDKDGEPVRLVGSMMDMTETKNVIIKLAESEEKFRTLVQQAADGIFLVDTEGNYLDANQSAAKLTGYTIEELKKMNAADIVDKEELKVKPLKLEEIKKGQTVFLERIITKKDGTSVHVDISAKLMDNGKVITVLRDTTQRKEAEQRISASELLYRRLFESSKDGIFILDGNSGFINDVNPFMIDLLGYSKEEFLGKQLWEIGLFKDIIANKESFISLKQLGYVRYENLPLKSKAGLNVSVEFISNSYDVNGKSVIQCNIRDITERKKAEEQLKESYERYEFVNKATQDTIWEWDYHTNCGKWGEGIIKIFGYSKENRDYDENWVKKYVHPGDQEEMERRIRVCIESGIENWQHEYRFRCADGSYKQVFDRGYIIYDNDIKPIRMIGAMTDVTEKKILEKELVEQYLKQQKLITEATIQAQEKERNELGRELHDNINQILATIKMFLGLARSGQGNMKEMIGKSYIYVNEVMEEIRRLSHSLVSPSLGDIGLKEALDDLIRDTNFYKNLQIKLVVDKSYNETVLDNNKKLMFFRIVQEQLNNIIKYAKATKVVIAFKADDRKIFFSIADNGVGFDVLKKSQGIGLKNINSRVEFYSGKMNIFSEPGNGCTLEVTIPYLPNKIHNNE